MLGRENFARWEPAARRRWFAIWLALFFSCFYLASARGTMSFGDDVSMLRVTESIATRGSVAVPPDTPGASQAKDGRSYSKYGLGQSLLGVPFYFAGSYFQSHCCPPNTFLNPSATPITYFVCMLGIFSGVGAIVLLYLSCIELGFDEVASLITAVAFGTCTFHWFYARTFMTEPPSTLLLLSTFYGLLRSNQATESKWIFVSGFGAGAAILVRLQNAIMLPAFGIWLLWEVHLSRRSEIKQVLVASIVWSAPIFASFLTIGIYNYARFGDVFDIGFGSKANFLLTRIHIGIYGFLLSPGKGMFWYAPILIPALYGWRFLWKKYGLISCVVCILVLTNLIFYSGLQFWFGGGVWGPRYMAQVLPFLMIGLAALIDHGLRPRGWLVVGALAALSIVIQIVSVLVSYIPYVALMAPSNETFDRTLWNPADSPIVVQFVDLIRHRYPFDLAYNAIPLGGLAAFQLTALLASAAILAVGAKFFLPLALAPRTSGFDRGQS